MSALGMPGNSSFDARVVTIESFLYVTVFRMPRVDSEMTWGEKLFDVWCTRVYETCRWLYVAAVMCGGVVFIKDNTLAFTGVDAAATGVGVSAAVLFIGTALILSDLPGVSSTPLSNHCVLITIFMLDAVLALWIIVISFYSHGPQALFILMTFGLWTHVFSGWFEALGRNVRGIRC